MADHRLDRGSSSHLAFDGGRHATLLACSEDPKPVTLRRVVAAVAGLGEDALDLGADGIFHRGNNRSQRVPVIGGAGKGHGVQGELVALRVLQRGGDGDLDAEFVGRVSLPLADALDLMGVQAVDFAAALTLPLSENGRGLVERPLEDRVQLRIIGDLALDVADDAPEIGLQFAQGLAGPLELLGMRIALILDQRQLADPDIALAQVEPHSFRQPHQPLAGAMDEFGVGREHDVFGLNRGVDDDPARVPRLHCSGFHRHRQAFLQ